MTMDNAAIDDKVREILANELSMAPEVVTPEATLRVALRMGDLEYIDVLDRLECEFDIDISDDEVAPMQTVGELMAYVRECLAEKG